MVDFIEAFTKGQTAAEIAKRNNSEISVVFEELNKQLDKASSGKLQILFQSMTKIETIDRPDAHGIMSFDLFLNPKKTKEYNAICATNPLVTNSPKKELAEWEQGRDGYPCKITIGNKQHYCEDKAELENALALMLQDSIIGIKLSELISLSDSEKSTAS